MEDSLFTEKRKRNPDRLENTKKTHETEAGASSGRSGKPSPGEVGGRQGAGLGTGEIMLALFFNFFKK